MVVLSHRVQGRFRTSCAHGPCGSGLVSRKGRAGAPDSGATTHIAGAALRPFRVTRPPPT
ncbi:hypothetical protein CMV24_14575 [Pseudomonas plecoglossicida]|uniref:Uncharacterized protein n=1 Tax=Pseudomonas plecoglossicida TaxID=70775 RepID=A0A2A3M3Q6_PSEDL|nr:hypothetical protein CMV24_14575 [Pseudomonas plecoglossicida]